MVPADLRAAVLDAAKHLAGLERHVRWVRPEGLHLTVRFLGECAPAQAREAEAAGGQAVAQAPFMVALGGLGVFPQPARPRVVWVGLTAGTSDLLALHGRLEEALLARRVVAERERLTPHLTLGRVRQETAPADLAALGRAVAAAPREYYGQFQATHLDLMESVLGRDGARYTTVASFPLHAEAS